MCVYISLSDSYMCWVHHALRVSTMDSAYCTSVRRWFTATWFADESHFARRTTHNDVGKVVEVDVLFVLPCVRVLRSARVVLVVPLERELYQLLRPFKDFWLLRRWSAGKTPLFYLSIGIENFRGQGDIWGIGPSLIKWSWLIALATFGKVKVWVMPMSSLY